MDIQGLKNKILQLAIQGKLVDQDPNDEPASVLLERIKKERDRLVKEGKIKKQKPLPKITDEEKPFEIPDNWEWVRLGEIGAIVGGGTPKTTVKEYWEGGTIPWITPADLSNHTGKYISRGKRSITPIGLRESSAQLMPKGTVLFSSRAPIGYTAIAKNEISTNQGFKSCVPFVMDMNEYLYYYLVYSAKIINENASGTTFKEVSGAEVSNLIVPLPPLAEQKRIVAKVDELFALIDELDSNKEELLEVINLTRNKVLQLAIQGKLVDQDPNDEPASVLLEKIKKERDRLVKEGKIRKQKPLPGITDEEKPFEIPESWEWVRLGDVALLNMGQSPSGDTVNDKEGMEFHQGKIYFGDKYLNKSNKYTTAPKKIAQPGDILLSVRAPVGAINITDRKVCIGRGLCAISSLGTMPNDYYFYFIKAFEEYLVENATGTTFSAVTASTVNEMKLPLPPVEEQERIVKKLDAIMNMLDELESQLSDSK